MALVAGLFFMPFLGAVRLFDWDEVNFAEISREMVVLGDYLRVHVDFEPFWEKPPFFFWMQSLAMHLFGVGEYAARFPNAVIGVLTLVLVFNLGRRLYSVRFGLLWAGAWLGSVTPHLYFRSGIIDPYFNFFIFCGLLGVIFFTWKKDRYDLPLSRGPYFYLLMGGFLLGVGILTKGPVAFLIVGLTMAVYWVRNRLRWFINAGQFLLFAAMASVVTLLWYGLETYAHGPWFIQEFIKYNYRLFSTPDAGHAGFFGYHFVILLVGCFPASIFALRGMGPTPQERNFQRDFKVWMVCLFWVVLILFSIVKSKIVHYSSMCYFPLTFLAALTLDGLYTGRIRFSGWLRAGLMGVGAVFVLIIGAVPLVGQHVEWLLPFVQQDPFAVANLQGATGWTNWALIPAIWLLLVLGLSLRWFGQRDWDRAVPTLLVGMAVFITLTLGFFMTRIENLIQGSAMRFFEKFQGKDVYVVPYEYRSYGPFFYTRRQPRQNPKRYDLNWILRGPVDRPTYVIAKITNPADSVRSLRRLGEENGFVFYERKK
ncbi:MAG: glycosyltransferase family 39 protein [Sphingobacteriaceae bacterium]|nr:glycosyltransferase family 39 protein [Cytophagaceae bacterium]